MMLRLEPSSSLAWGKEVTLFDELSKGNHKSLLLCTLVGLAVVGAGAMPHGWMMAKKGQLKMFNSTQARQVVSAPAPPRVAPFIYFTLHRCI
jgi:hypothetical protein